MRKADFDKAWETCRKFDRDTLDLKLIIINVFNTELILNITSRVLAIVGANGVGKTSFIEKVNRITSGRQCEKKADFELVRFEGQYRGNFLGLPAFFPMRNGESVPEILLIDASLDVHEIRKYILSITNLEEMLPQVGARVLKQKEVSQYRHVVHKYYESIEIYEFESATEVDEVFPFFIVKIDGFKYDSRTMGFGELSACYIIWTCLRAKKGTILLFDEPDSHLSPYCRTALLNFFAYAASENNLQIIFTSHSSETVATLNPQEMILIDKTSGPGLCISQDKRKTLRRLGFVSTPRLLLITEDVDGHELLLCILAKWASDFKDVVDVQMVLGGAAELVRLQRFFPKESRACRLQVVLDGDKRLEYAKNNAELLFLPDIYDPVESARITVTANPDYFTLQLGVPLHEVTRSLKATRHLDHHDFCSAFAQELNVQGIDTKRVRTNLFKAWLEVPAHAQDSQQLSKQILTLIGDE